MSKMTTILEYNEPTNPFKKAEYIKKRDLV